MLPHFDLERQRAEEQAEDHVLGAVSPPCIYAIPEAVRLSYIPTGELQFGAEDFQDCASRGPVNLLEAKFTYAYLNGLMKPENRQWLRDKGYIQNGKVTFSDRFVAIGSGTTRSGNSLKAPVDFIYRNGLIPKSMLPKIEGSTWEQHHDPSKVTEEMRALGRQFVARWTINYERVYTDQFPQELKKDFLDLALNAWLPPVNGEYPDPANSPPNHVVAGIKPQTFVADNYIDKTDGDFIKKLAPNFTFYEYGYRLPVSKEVTQEEQKTINTVFEVLRQKGLLAFFAKFLEDFTRRMGGIWQN